MDKAQLNTPGDLQKSIQVQNCNLGVKWIRVYWPAANLDEFLTEKEFGVLAVPLVVSLRDGHYDVAVREDVCKTLKTELLKQIRPRLPEGSYDAIRHTIQQLKIVKKRQLWMGQMEYLNEEIQRLEACLRNNQQYVNGISTPSVSTGLSRGAF